MNYFSIHDTEALKSPARGISLDVLCTGTHSYSAVSLNLELFLTQITTGSRCRGHGGRGSYFDCQKCGALRVVDARTGT